jgi:hypothetical protein
LQLKELIEDAYGRPTTTSYSSSPKKQEKARWIKLGTAQQVHLALSTMNSSDTGATAIRAVTSGTSTQWPWRKTRRRRHEYTPNTPSTHPGYTPIHPFCGTTCLAVSPLLEPFYRQVFIIRGVLGVLNMRSLLGNAVFVQDTGAGAPKTVAEPQCHFSPPPNTPLCPRIKSQSGLGGNFGCESCGYTPNRQSTLGPGQWPLNIMTREDLWLPREETP